MTVFLCCLCAARILTAADPAPASGSTVSRSKAESLTPGEDQLELPEGASVSTRKSKFPQRPETLDSLFNSSQSLPTTRLPQPQSLSNQRSRKMLEEKEDWIFLTPEDLLQDLMIKEKLVQPEYGIDGREKSSLTPVERYYDRISRARTNSASASLKKPFGGATEDSDLVSGLDDLTSARDRSLPGLEKNSGRLNGFADLFGVNKDRGPKGDYGREQQDAEERAQALHLENFRKHLELPPVPDAAADFGLPANLEAKGPAWESYSAAARPNPYTASSSIQPPSPPPGLFGAPAIAPPQLTPGQELMTAPPPSLTETRTPAPKLQFSVPMRKF